MTRMMMKMIHGVTGLAPILLLLQGTAEGQQHPIGMAENGLTNASKDGLVKARPTGTMNKNKNGMVRMISQGRDGPRILVMADGPRANLYQEAAPTRRGHTVSEIPLLSQLVLLTTTLATTLTMGALP